MHANPTHDPGIVSILVVPSNEPVMPRALSICHDGDPRGLIQLIKQHRGDCDASLISRLRKAVAVARRLPQRREFGLRGRQAG